MPSTPRRKSVAAAVQTALLAIDGTSAYFNDVDARVYLYNRSPVTIHDYPAIVIYEGRERKELDNATKFTCALSFAIAGYVREGDDSEKSGEIAEMLHDIEKALMADHTLGGETIDIDILGNTFIMNEKSDRVGVIVEVEVLYQHSVTDPSATS